MKNNEKEILTTRRMRKFFHRFSTNRQLDYRHLFKIKQPLLAIVGS